MQSVLKIQVIKAKVLGLDVYKVFVNRVYATEFLSQNAALAYISKVYGCQVVKQFNKAS
jgi:hypothetical protein